MGPGAWRKRRRQLGPGRRDTVVAGRVSASRKGVWRFPAREAGRAGQPREENGRLGRWGAEQRRWAQGRAGDGGRRRREREKWNRRGGRQDGISATDGMRCQWTRSSAARPRRHCGFPPPQARSAPLPQSCCSAAAVAARPCKPSVGPRYRRAALLSPTAGKPLPATGGRGLNFPGAWTHREPLPPSHCGVPGATSPAKLSSRTDERQMELTRMASRGGATHMRQTPTP